MHRADSRFAPSQWEMSLQSNAISHWLGTNLESALYALTGTTDGCISMANPYNKYIWDIQDPFVLYSIVLGLGQPENGDLSQIKMLLMMQFLSLFNTLKRRQNGHHFPDDILKCILLNENVWILIPLKFVFKGPINNIPALVQRLAWHRPGDKPVSGPVRVKLLMHICVTRPQWVKPSSAETGIFPGNLGQYHGCWCPGSSNRQDISSHDIDCVQCG